MEVHDSFLTFTANLIIPDSMKEVIEQRIKTITKRINKDYWNIDSELLHSKIVGSYGRGTAIQNSDVDIVVELPWTEYTRFKNYSYNGQSAFLQSVKQCILKSYPTSDVSGDGQVVVIDFSDGIKFEIVPSFLFDNGDYYYADSNDGGKWKSMNPTQEINQFNKCNLQFNRNLRRLCRMLRAWKNTKNVPIPGILIDTIAYNFLSQYQYSKQSYTYYDWMTRDFFEYMSNMKNVTSWTIFSSAYTITLKYPYTVFSKVQKAHMLALEAISAYSGGYYNLSHSKWRELYGTKFPKA